MAPLISYAPGGKSGINYIFSNRTIGPTTSITKTQTLPATGGTLAAVQAASYPAWGAVGTIADAGEICDCLNQLVARIESLEAIIQANPAYGVVQT